MNVLLTGAKGMLASDVKAVAPATVTLLETDVEELDITNRDAVTRFCAEQELELVLNCAAYTAVDKAESDQELAYAINEQGPANLAAACCRLAIPLVHVSTDFVFFGDGSHALTEDDVPAPRGVYAQSKRAGELAIEHAGCDWLTVRTSWLYGLHGKNFPATMLALAAERDQLTVVYDQQGSPTYSRDLAYALWQLITRTARGYVHFCNRGVCSWYDFAVETISRAREIGLLPADRQTEIIPVTSEEFIRPAPRPAYSGMSTVAFARLTGSAPRPWQDGLQDFLTALHSLQSS